jgi:hypothetical protein
MQLYDTLRLELYHIRQYHVSSPVPFGFPLLESLSALVVWVMLITNLMVRKAYISSEALPYIGITCRIQENLKRMAERCPRHCDRYI